MDRFNHYVILYEASLIKKYRRAFYITDGSRNRFLRNLLRIYESDLRRIADYVTMSTDMRTVYLIQEMHKKFGQ
jgi:hypothetical protein